MTANEAVKILNEIEGSEEPFPYFVGITVSEALQLTKKGVQNVLARHGNIELSTHNHGGLEKRIRQLKENNNGKSK